MAGIPGSRLAALAGAADAGASSEKSLPLHSLAVDDAVREILRSRPDAAQDAAALLSHGRSGHETVHHVRHSGRFQPPEGTCNNGAVSLVTGVGSLSFDGRSILATLLCAPDELILFAIVHVSTYESLLWHAGIESRCQSALFADNRRSALFYSTVRNATKHRPTVENAPFWVSIPNGLAFLRIADVDVAYVENGCPFALENVGLFRFYESRPAPKLRFVLQVDAAPSYASRWTWPTTRNAETASLEALLAFLSAHPVADAASPASWAGASEAAQTATPPDVAEVAAEQFGMAVSGGDSRIATVLRRLKRALEDV